MEMFILSFFVIDGIHIISRKLILLKERLITEC